MKQYILVVGAAPEVSRLIRMRLEDGDTKVLCSATAEDARLRLSTHKAALVMLELSHLQPNSRPLLQAINRLSPVPILILFANGEDGSPESDALLDCAFGVEGCIARAKSYLEHYRKAGGGEKPHLLSCGQDMVIDLLRRRVSLRGKELALSQKQFDLLYCLASHPGEVLTRDQLFDYLWGEPDLGFGNSIAMYISKLRKTLGETPEAPAYIHTVRGTGYRFISA